MTFYSPWAFLGLIAVPIIIILYLLKQRHKDYTVSSLFLWEEVLKDLEANAPWQKLRKNLLMILQIIAALLLVFTMARPFLNSISGDVEHVVVAVDTSLSMKASDVGESRFEEAKSKARGFIGNLKPDTLVTLISLGRNANIEENLSNDRGSLLDKLNRLKVTNGTTDIEEAESLIASISKQHPVTHVVVFSDREIDVPGVNLEFTKISNDGDNYAITLMSHAKSEKGLTVLTRITNYSRADSQVPVSLYLDGKVFDAQNVDVKVGDTANAYWNNIPQDIKLIEARIDRKDALDIDNRAWNAVNDVKEYKALLISDSNVFIEKVVSLHRGVELYKAGYEDSNDLKGYDLYIFDGFIPDKIPDDGNLMVLNPPENKTFDVAGEVNTPVIEELGEDIFKFAEGFDFSIGKTKILEVPQWGKSILNTADGSAAFTGVYGNSRILVLGFDIHNTDIPLTPAFPIIMVNALDWLLPASVANSDNVFAGEGVEFNISPKTQEAYIENPSGENIQIAPPFPVKIFDGTDEPGLYMLKQKTEDTEQIFYFTVNVPSQSESNLSFSVEEESNGTGTEDDNSSSPINTGMNLQTIFLWLILLVLLIEWWVYTNVV